jgi:formylglycine-generating enzyme required for sulfatase activity
VAFDPYYKWLGIASEEQPANSYRLLGVRLFEDDLDVISNAADQRMAHLRTFQTGPHGPLSQKLLNEVAAVRVCLLNPAKKAQHDAALREKLAAKDPASSQEYQNVLEQLANESRRELAQRPRSSGSPHLVFGLVVAGVVVAVMVLAAVVLLRGNRPSAGVAPRPKPVELAERNESRRPAPPPQPKPAPKPEPKPEPPKPEPKPEPVVMPAPAQPEPKPEPQPAPKPEFKLDPAPPAPTVPPVVESKPQPEPETPPVGPQLGAKLNDLKQASRGAVPATRRKILEQAVAMVKESIAADQYDLALDAAKLATMESGRLRDKELVKQARAAMQEAQQREKAFSGVRAAKETLVAKPDDPEANLAYGKFLCFAKSDWHRGLPRLAKSQDTPIAKLAAKDIAESNKPEEQVSIADAWWEAAEAEPLAARKNILLHAAMWYYRASFQLSGVQKSLADKRIKQAGLETQITNPVDGSVLVLIPEGKFLSGENRHEAYLPAYYLGMYEVTFLQFDRFVKATGHSPPTTAAGDWWGWSRTGNLVANLADKPVGCAQPQDADDYSRWAGLRLPKVIECEKGARGTDGRTYPWGNDWDATKCQTKSTRIEGITSGIAAHAAGRSPWGLYHTVDNSVEYCADREGESRCFYGAGSDSDDRAFFVTWRSGRWFGPGRWAQNGFRVARDFRP